MTFDRDSSASFHAKLPRIHVPDTSQKRDVSSNQASHPKRAKLPPAPALPSSRPKSRPSRQAPSHDLFLDDEPDISRPEVLNAIRPRPLAAVFGSSGVGTRAAPLVSNSESSPPVVHLNPKLDLLLPRTKGGVCFSRPQHQPRQKRDQKELRRRLGARDHQPNSDDDDETPVLVNPAQPLLNLKHEIIMPAAPAVGFSRAPRFKKEDDDEKASDHETEGKTRKPFAPLDLNTAYEAILPRANRDGGGVAMLSKVKRFPEPSREKEYPAPPPLVISHAAEIEPAISDKALQPHLPIPTFSHPNVKEAIQKDLEEKRMMREARRREAEAKVREERSGFSSPDRMRSRDNDPTPSTAQRSLSADVSRFWERLYPDPDIHATPSRPAQGVRAGGGEGELRSLDPAWELIEKRVKGLAVWPRAQDSTRRSVSAGGSSREEERRIARLGPGYYRGADAAISLLSYRPRPAATVIPKGASSSHGFTSLLPSSLAAYEGLWHAKPLVPSAASLAAWNESDLGAAMDNVGMRVLGGVIGTSEDSWLRASSQPAGEVGEEVMLEVNWGMIMPRIKGGFIPQAPRMVSLPIVTITEEGEQGEMTSQGTQVEDPWVLDANIRTAAPSFSFPMGLRWAEKLPSMDHHNRPLAPNYDFTRPTFAISIPAFSTFVDRFPSLRPQAYDKRDYDVTPALEFLQRHVPGPMWQAMEERWRLPAPLALTLGGEEALLDLSTAIESVLPRVTSVVFSALPSSTRRVPKDEGRPLQSHERMTLDELEAAWDEIKRRAVGSLGGPIDFKTMVGRLEGPEEKRRVEERHLAPGGYEIEAAYHAIEPEVNVRAFESYLGRPSTIVEEEAEGGEEGEGVDFNPGQAKDLLLPRRGIGALAFDLAPSRSQEDKRLPDEFGANTKDLDFGDPNLDQAIRKRVQGGVNLATALGRPSSPMVDPEEAKRGPGMYQVSSHAVEPSPKAADFTRGQGRPLDSSPKIKDGDRLILFPNLDVVRPIAPTAVIAPEHESVPRRKKRWNKQTQAMEDIDEEPDEYFHAVYEPNIDAVKKIAPRPRDFGAMLAREGLEGVRTSGRLLDYHIEDVPLTVLAGFRAAPKAPSFKTMAPHRALIPEKEDNDGQRLDLDPAAALDNIKRKVPQALPMEKQLGRRQEEEEEDFTDYQPKIDLIKPSAPPAANLGKLVSREEASRVAAGDNATGDLDGGAYNPKTDFVLPKAPSVGFGLAEDRRDAMDKAMRGEEGGNVLLLNPLHPSDTGWKPKLVEGEPLREPFGRVRDRWADDGDQDLNEGNVLMLRTSMDDLAKAKRPTAANPPILKWTTPGPALPRESFEALSLTPGEHRPTRRMREAMGPDEALVARRIETVMTNVASSNVVLEAVRRDPKGQIAQDLRRRERVWSRMEGGSSYQPYGIQSMDEASDARASAFGSSFIGQEDSSLRPRDQALVAKLRVEERSRLVERITGGLTRQVPAPRDEASEPPLPDKIKMPPWNLIVPDSQPLSQPRPPSLLMARSLRDTSGWGRLRSLFRDSTVDRQREDGGASTSWGLSYEARGEGNK